MESAGPTSSGPVARNPLARTSNYIGGAWRESSDGETVAVINPATGNTIAWVASGTAADAELAVLSADEARRTWAATTASGRAEALHRWRALIMANVDDLAQILTAEQGKPLIEARAEIHYGAAFIDWFAEEGKRVYGETIPANRPDRRAIVLRQPIGVCGAITPWNFPSAMILRKAGPALAAGCTLIVKPATETPLSALALAELADQAGIPPGVFNVVHGTPDVLGRVLTSHPAVRMLSFTGSTMIGKRLMAQCAGTVKRVALELGGNAPLIVFEDADMETAVSETLEAKFRNAGQTCVSANRILVQQAIHDEFVERLLGRMRHLRLGSGFDPTVNVGPLINDQALAKVERHVNDAREHHASVLVGGSRHELGGTFFQPTLIVGVSTEMTVANEETFGPIAPVMSFDDEDEAIALANSTQAGLSAYLFSRDLARIWRVTEALEFGVVGVNTAATSHEGAPFGGVKESGLGREGSRHGIDDYLEHKYLCLAGL